MNLRISELKRQARGALEGKWGLTVLLTFIIILLEAIVPSIIEIPLSGGFSAFLSQNDTPTSVNIFDIVYSLALLPFSVGVYWFYLNLVRGNNPEISQTFSIYKDGNTLFKMIGVTLLQVLYTLLWTILLIIPGIIKGLSYSQTYFILKDHPEYTANRAITESKIRMKGYKWKYFLMNLSFIGWGILAMIPFGIGILWLMPYVTTTMAAFYNELIASQENDPKEIDF